jgi:molybdopterin-binding protein
VEGLVPVGEHWEGKVGEQVLHLGRDANLKAGRGVCLQFLPSDVILATGSPQGLSVRNRLRGKVREVVVLPGQTFVALDVGQFLWAEVTPEASRELDLRPGQEVTCLVKSTAFTVLPLTWETEAAP